MFQSALFIVSGVALYGGVHQLYLGIRQQDQHPRIVLALMFVLLAGFAISSAAGASAQSVGQFTLYGKLAVSQGILLCALLPWLVVLCLRDGNHLMPALISAAWSVLLLLNLGSASSLLYLDVNLLNQTLPSGQVIHSLHTSPGPWWRLVEIGMLSTLIFSFYVTYRHYRLNSQALAITLAAGLLVLLCTTLADLMINAGLIQSAYLTPMGFFLFLLIASVFTLQPSKANQATREPAETRYQLTLNLNQSAKTQDNLNGLRETTPPAPAAEITHQQIVPAFRVTEQVLAQPVFETTHSRSAMRRESVAPETPRVAQQTSVPAPEPEQRATSETRIDNPTVDEISDGLVDIAVHATMILKRLQSGQADPQQLEALSRKVRTRAIEARRITHRMVRPPENTPSD